MSHGKEELRQKCRRVRTDFVNSNKDISGVHRRLSNKILDLLKSWKLADGEYVASYCAKGTEANINHVPHEMNRLKWVYPRVSGESMEFLFPQTCEDFEMSRWGIAEPLLSSEKVSVDQCVAFLIPGLAFDHQGSRLGQGKGYYDRALQSARGKKVGIAYSAQMLNENLNVADHDVAMDFVVTEDFILEPLRRV